MDIYQYVMFIQEFLDRYEFVAHKYLGQDDFSFAALRHAREIELPRLISFVTNYHGATEEEQRRLNRICQGMALLIDASPDWEAQTSWLFDFAAMLEIRASNVWDRGQER
ncbi:MAG: hypothetical protein ACXWQ5_00670 [Ktedonobacterales bacterium]